MAIFSKILVATTLLSSFALAAPLNRPNIFTALVTEIDWTTVDVTTTVYVGGTSTTAVSIPSEVSVSTTSAIETTPTSTSIPTPSVVVASSSSPVAPSTSAAVVPTTSTSAVIVETSAAPSSTVIASTSTPAPVSTSSTVSAAGVAAAAAVTTAATAGGPTTASDSATCEGEGNACVGDITHWDGGLGACGTTVDTNSDYAIALPYQFMGTLSNTNPYCGRSLTIYNPTTGLSVQAVVADKCMGCVDRAIDLTDVLFTAVAPTGNGRVSGIDWWLN